MRLLHKDPDCTGRWALRKDRGREPWRWIECPKCGKEYEHTEAHVYAVTHDDALCEQAKALTRAGRTLLDDDSPPIRNRLK